jgi:hypothetical protein
LQAAVRVAALILVAVEVPVDIEPVLECLLHQELHILLQLVQVPQVIDILLMLL